MRLQLATLTRDSLHSTVSPRGVTDFIDIGVASWRFWTFNVADAGITIGAVLLAFVLLARPVAFGRCCLTGARRQLFLRILQPTLLSWPSPRRCRSVLLHVTISTLIRNSCQPKKQRRAWPNSRSPSAFVRPSRQTAFTSRPAASSTGTNVGGSLRGPLLASSSASDTLLRSATSR